MSLGNIRRFISSRVLAVGPTPCSSRSGRKKNKSGRVAVRVNRIARRVKVEEMKTPEISGRSSDVSSQSVILQWSLESRLRALLEGAGSPEYELIWKKWTMLSEPAICALQASVRRTFGRGSGGWPTPTSQIVGDKKDYDYQSFIRMFHRILGKTPAASFVRIGAPGVMNPALSRWLIGFPQIWDKLSPNWKNWKLWQKLLKRMPAQSETGGDA